MLPRCQSWVGFFRTNENLGLHNSCPLRYLLDIRHLYWNGSKVVFPPFTPKQKWVKRFEGKYFCLTVHLDVIMASSVRCLLSYLRKPGTFFFRQLLNTSWNLYQNELGSRFPLPYFPKAGMVGKFLSKLNVYLDVFMAFCLSRAP